MRGPSWDLAEIRTCADRQIHVLTLTPFYPSATDDTYGCYVAEPLALLNKFGIVSTVMAVRPIYRGPAERAHGAPAATWVRYPQLPGNVGLPSASMFLFACTLRSLRRLHKAQNIDLIHAHGALPCGHAAAWLSRALQIPFVVTVHGLDAFATRQVKGPLGRWCKGLSRVVYRSAHRVICVSERVQREVLQTMGDGAETSVVYNGVDPTLFAPAPDTDKPPTATLLSVGNLIPIKGHEIVLRAAGGLVGKYPSLRYEIIGDGPEQARLSALAKELGVFDKVRFLGRQSRREVAEAMKRCTVFALPSCYEALGCVYLEAMATAKPVIACRGQGVEEIIRHGENGWLVRSDNLQDMVQALSTLLGDACLRNRLGQEGRRTVVEGLTLTHQAERLSRVYRECLK